MLNSDLLQAQYKNSKALSVEAETLTKNGNLVVAENRFASAAKLVLYEGDAGQAKKYLAKCIQVKQTKNSNYESVSDNFDTVSACVMKFHRAKLGSV